MNKIWDRDTTYLMLASVNGIAVGVSQSKSKEIDWSTVILFAGVLLLIEYCWKKGRG